MIAAERVVLVLLAAGRSERFGGNGNKLDQPFLGRPLGLHVAVAMENIPFLERVAIVGGAALDYAPFGFTVIRNPDRDSGMSSSIRLGIERAAALDADAALIALADMPRVTESHIYNLLDAANGPETVVASTDGTQTKPPALFPNSHFNTLSTLKGDSGARDIVRAGRHLVASPDELIDIDTPEDLQRLQEPIRAHEKRVVTGQSGVKRSDWNTDI